MAKTVEVKGHVFTQGKYGLYYTNDIFSMTQDELDEWSFDDRFKGAVLVSYSDKSQDDLHPYFIEIKGETKFEDYKKVVLDLSNTGYIGICVALDIPDGFLGIMVEDPNEKDTYWLL